MDTATSTATLAPISAPKGAKKPIHETIRHGALAISPDLFVNSHHTGALSAFAFARDGSPKASWDNHGLKFEASLPDTFAGRDVRNALMAGLRLGVSVEFADAQYETVDGVQEIVSGTLMGISLTRPGMAYYRQPCVWLADARADTLPKDVRALRNKWMAPEPAPMAFLTPKEAAFARNEPKRFANWLAYVKERGCTAAKLLADGIRPDIIERARKAGLK
jgi:hypothetical protein